MPLPDADGQRLGDVIMYWLQPQFRSLAASVIEALHRVNVPGFGTMGVGVSKEGRMCLFYDEDMVSKMPLQELLLTFTHELIHILNDHIPRCVELMSTLRTKKEKARFKAVQNIAADLATNEVMRLEPGFDDKYKDWFFGSDKTDGRLFLTPETYKMPRAQPYEVYQFGLLQQLDQRSGGGGGSEGGGCGSEQELRDQFTDSRGGDPHAHWRKFIKGRTSEELVSMAEELRHQARDTVEKALAQHEKARGVTPAYLKERIEAFLKPPVIPWPVLLRRMCIRTKQRKSARGMQRPNRRLHEIDDILPYPGKKYDNKFTIVFTIDTSGSMSHDDLKLAMEELLSLATSESDVYIWVMQCDSKVAYVKPAESVSDIDFDMVGRGGTDFDPVFVKTKELLKTSMQKPDVLVYATDGYAPEPKPEVRVPIPVVWLITPGGKMPSPGYGLHLPMENVPAQ